MRFRFGDHLLDPERRELHRGGLPVTLEPRVFDLLVHLIRHRDRVVSKDELIETVWGGRIVSDAAIDTRIKAARRAVGDNGAAQAVIRTFARKGVRFVAEATVEVTSYLERSIAQDVQSQTDAGDPGAPFLALPDKPSIAVLPFANISGDPEQEYFADGMVEEIITALSRIRWLFVIARNSSFTYKNQVVDIRRVGRDLGVRYVLEGSVRKGGDRIRITAQLIEAETGTHLWADRFDGQMADVFALQDDVATSVAGVIEPRLQAAEVTRSGRPPTTDLTAYDLYLRALANFPWTDKEQIFRALKLFDEALVRDPNYGPALSWAAVCRDRMLIDGYTDDHEESRREALAFANRALATASADPGVLANVALVLGDLGRDDIGAAIALIDRSVGLNPSSARGWFISGLLRVFAGECDAAIRCIEMSMRLAPRDPVGVPIYVMRLALFFNRQFELAAEQLRLSALSYPGWPLPYRALAACYAQAGRLPEAREIIARLRAFGPVDAHDVDRYRRAEDRELYVGGLRKAELAD
jgi:TolB-like protein/tetratricopeptide (TPR) repeat protein